MQSGQVPIGREWLDSSLPWLEEWGVPPRVFAALVVLLLGLVLAFVLRAVATRATRKIARRLSLWGDDAELLQSKRSEKAVGVVAYWTPLVLSAVVASEILGFPWVTRWLTEIALYLPRLIAAVLIVVMGLLAAKGVGALVLRAANSAAIPAARRLRRAVEISIVLASLVVAVEQLGLEISFLKTLLVIGVAAILLGAALAFGLGSRDIVANVLAAHYLQRVYQVGQTIRVDGVEGRIVRITEIALIVDDGDGEVVIPAQQLTRERSTLVLKQRAK